MRPPPPFLALVALLVVSAFSEKARVIFMAGQSNMSGLGVIRCEALNPEKAAACRSSPGDALTPAQLAKVSATTSRILLAATHTGHSISSFAPMSLPQYDIPGWESYCGHQGCLFGSEVGLAHYSKIGVEATEQSPLHLVKFHAPGTALCPGSSGAFWEGGLGDEMRFAFEQAISNLGGPGNVEILGMLWHQGEGDLYSSCQQTYSEHFHAFMQKNWARFGSFPVVVGLIGARKDMWEPELRAIVRHEQSRLPELDSRIRVIDLGDLQTHSYDLAHYDSQSLIEMGIRFANCLEDRLSCHPTMKDRSRRSLLFD